MSNMILAILRPDEEECKLARHGFAYRFKYDENDLFSIKVDGTWQEIASTEFNFIRLEL